MWVTVARTQRRTAFSMYPSAAPAAAATAAAAAAAVVQPLTGFGSCEGPTAACWRATRRPSCSRANPTIAVEDTNKNNAGFKVGEGGGSCALCLRVVGMRGLLGRGVFRYLLAVSIVSFVKRFTFRRTKRALDSLLLTAVDRRQVCGLFLSEVSCRLTSVTSVTSFYQSRQAQLCVTRRVRNSTPARRCAEATNAGSRRREIRHVAATHSGRLTRLLY